MEMRSCGFRLTLSSMSGGGWLFTGRGGGSETLGSALGDRRPPGAGDGVPLGSRAAGLGSHGATTLKNKALQSLWSGCGGTPGMHRVLACVGGTPSFLKPFRGACEGLALTGCRLRRRTLQRLQEAGWTQGAAPSRAAVWAAVPLRQVGRAGRRRASESCGRGGSGSGVIGASRPAGSSCDRPHPPQA